MTSRGPGWVRALVNGALATSAKPGFPVPRLAALAAVGSAVALLPWIVYLGLTLPSRSDTTHYALAWVGFDCGMWLVLIAFAVAAVRRHPAIGPIAAVAAMMLLVDAWFDVSTSSGAEFTLAVVLAACAELPFAALCTWIAVRSERARLRAFRRLRAQWEATTSTRWDPAAEVAPAVLATLSHQPGVTPRPSPVPQPLQ